MMNWNEKTTMESAMDIMEIDSPVDQMEEMSFEDSDCNNFVFVDIQGFKTIRNRFMCKEFCLVDGEYKYHALVKSPYSFNKMSSHNKQNASWLINNFHGLKYECGDVHMIELLQNTYPKLMNKTILVKGKEKVQWMQYMYRNCGEISCVNVEDLDAYDWRLRREESYQKCDYHDDRYGWKDYRCAMASALELQDILRKNCTNDLHKMISYTQSRKMF